MDDPISLFSSSKDTSGSRSRNSHGPPSSFGTPDAPSKRDATKDDASFYVEIPLLSKDMKEKYQAGDLPDSDDDVDSEEVIELVGEHVIGRKHYLFARHKDNIVRKKESWEFKTSYPGLYDEYMRKKKSATLEPFDPSAVYVHPRDRVGLMINIDTRKIDMEKVTKGHRRSETIYREDDLEASDEDTDEDVGDEDGDYAGKRTRGKRKSTRQKSKSQRVLPFSPVKTRRGTGTQTNVVNLVEGSPSEDELAPKRRSLRGQAKKVYTQDDDDFEAEEVSEDEYEEMPAQKAKRVVKRTGPKPAYGRFRKVDDAYDSDPETAPLRGHRDECEKCHRGPAHILLKKRKRGRKKKDDEELSEDDESYFNSLGGWVRCLKCCVSAHWRCLANTQRDEILRAARARTKELLDADGIPRWINGLEVHETTDFVCGACSKGGICMVCKNVAIEPETKLSLAHAPKSNDDVMDIDGDVSGERMTRVDDPEQTHELLFRCYTCKRLAHYSHLEIDDDEASPVEVAEYFQKENKWLCSDCVAFDLPLDKIIAWRPFPPNAVDAYSNSSETPNIKENLPREYLVKWIGRSFRRTQWVPHMWLTTTNPAKLKNFYVVGPKLELLNNPDKNAGIPCDTMKPAELTLFATEDENFRDPSADAESKTIATVGPPAALADAEMRISPLWKTVDRVLDILVWSPRKFLRKAKKGKRVMLRVVDDDESNAESVSSDAQVEYDAAHDAGVQPSEVYTETIDEFEDRTGRKFVQDDIDKVIWAFIKWDDLPYDEATWDAPPRSGETGYPAFERAFEGFLLSRTVVVPKKSKQDIEKFEKRNGKKTWDSKFLGVPEDGIYNIGQDGQLKLMPFQVDGVNWLCRNWFHHQQCILADEMGLGKTVQIITFLGILHARLKVFPALIVVPNSTITNWVREFARWAPHLRVVPFYGEQKSREIVKKYELQHAAAIPGTTGAKYHVLVTTYETVTGQKDFTPVFRNTPRWEVLIVDEGQRLKSDSNMIFKRLNELNSCQRIIMTGTPLNNNIRELFNLMNFLDPEEWKDLEGLTKEFGELNEDRVKDLHERLRPYFLRRVKADVLDLPPKNEVIVPLSMAPLQKEIYKSILSKNLDVLRSLTEASTKRLNKHAINKSNLRNMLMQLRKCLQHPYLIADDIEPKDLAPGEAHLKMIDASGKLRFLKMLLPKLKARGHRVLLFSQFVIGLNIIEDFLQGEGYKFLRLDGNVKQAERQKDMDEFNRENSDIFIFILSTRAGGVGINLWSADTVIIFDPDFNPHQDLQAIARAHRYGQKKTCLVFKFMTKDSAEEKIMQSGKKKLVLDHLIVQNMDDEEDAKDVQSMLTFGAKALFNETEGHESRDINYSENDVEKLIEKTETEGDQPEASESTNNVFSFAKVWSAHKESLDEMPDEIEDADQVDSWAQTLAKIAAEQGHVEAQEVAGRGVRRKAALVKTKYFDGFSPEKPEPNGKTKRKSSGESDDSDGEYSLPTTAREESESPRITPGAEEEIREFTKKMEVHPNAVSTDAYSKYIAPFKMQSNRKAGQSSSAHRLLSPIHNQPRGEECGLCGTFHGPGECFMTQNLENLAEYRKMLIMHTEDESYEDRAEAIRAIDETLSKRGAINMISGQPLKPFEKKAHLHMHTAKKPRLHISNGLADDFSASASSSNNLSQELGESKYVMMNESSSSFGSIFEKGRAPDVPKISMKRLTSPSIGSTTNKKPKTLRSCEICKQSPHHAPLNCPTVAKGPQSVRKAIARLTTEGGSQDTIVALRNILREQRKVSEVQAQQIAAGTSSTS